MHLPGLYLLLEVMLHAHAELIQLIPLLRERHGAVLGVAVVKDETLLHRRRQVLDLLELTALRTHLDRLPLHVSKNREDTEAVSEENGEEGHRVKRVIMH